MRDPLLLLLEKNRIFDMPSLAGGAPSRLTPEQIAAEWEEGLRPIEAVHHQSGNYPWELGAGSSGPTEGARID